MNKAYKCHIFFLVIFLFWIDLSARNFSFYLKSEINYDNNIYENIDSSISSYGEQFWTGIKWQKRTNKHFFNFNLKSNFSCYNKYRNENKLINILNADYLYQPVKEIYLQTTISGFNKNWTQINRGYHIIGMTENLSYQKKLITLQLNLSAMKRDYYNYEQFDNHNYGSDLQLNYNPGSNWLYYLNIGWENFVFPAGKFYDDSLNVILDKKRNDQRNKITIGFETSKKILLGGAIIYQYTDSNYEYLANRNLGLRIYGSARVSSIYIQLILQSRIKKYILSSEIDNIFYNPDPEHNQQNKVMLGLEYNLTDNFSLTSKFAWYHNESTYISRYYEKMILSAGLQYNFR